PGALAGAATGGKGRAPARATCPCCRHADDVSARGGPVRTPPDCDDCPMTVARRGSMPVPPSVELPGREPSAGTAVWEFVPARPRRGRPAPRSPPMSPDLDALKRTEAAPAAPRRARAGLVLGVMLGVGALGWAFLLVRPAIFPARVVETAPVRVESGPSRVGTAVAATGYVEPAPFATIVRPLVAGIGET